jgi:hypothetical protein
MWTSWLIAGGARALPPQVQRSAPRRIAERAERRRKNRARVPRKRRRDHGEVVKQISAS